MKINTYFFIVSRSLILRMRNISENQNTHFMFNKFFFFENLTVYEIMWKKYGRAGQATAYNIIWRMRVAYWLTKITNTDSEYVILIAFALQQRLRERASILRYMYIACLVTCNVVKSITRKLSRTLEPFDTHSSMCLQRVIILLTY